MNPIILRGVRERLRIKHLIAAGLFSLIITSTVYFSAYLNEANGGWNYNPQTGQMEQDEPSPVKGARHAFTFLLSLQGFYLMFLGTGRVAAISAEEKESGLMDYQRMTPMNPFSKIVGYLFGLPAREYYMFALTLPFLLHCIIVGELAFENIVHLYFVFFSSVMLYHLTAHVIGLVVPKPRAASWVSRIVVLGLYVFLPAFGQAGISFLSFLTILPTYFGKMLPELIEMENSEYYRSNDMINFWQDVPFFGTEISPSLFTLIMQGLILAALLVSAYRKWRNESLPAFSKTSGLIIFAVFQFLLLGSLWPFFSEGKASGLLGENFSLSEAENRGGAPVILLFVQSVFFGLSLLGILTLVNTCCPDRHLHLKGAQRANRLGLPSIPMFADESRGTWFVLALGAMVCTVHAILLSQAVATDLFFSIKPELTAFYLPSLLLIACALYLQAARELWFSLGFWGFVGLLWITPLLASLVLAVGWEEKSLDTVAMLSSLCPILCLPQILASHYPIPIPDEHLHILPFGAFTGLGTASILAIVFSIRLHRKTRI
ncbi:MAG: hypothetical protein CMI29_10960 [Opitutae bacterium]|nr:hypothetical protein [Opitutae bacterium]